MIVEDTSIIPETSKDEESINILSHGVTYVRILEYFQDEKNRFKDKVNFEEVEKFVNKFFDPNIKMNIVFAQGTDDNLQLGKHYLK